MSLLDTYLSIGHIRVHLMESLAVLRSKNHEGIAGSSNTLPYYTLVNHYNIKLPKVFNLLLENSD